MTIGLIILIVFLLMLFNQTFRDAFFAILRTLFWLILIGGAILLFILYI